MEKLEKQFDVAIHWRSFELRPKGSPAISPQYRERIEASRPMLQKRAREEYGVEMNAGPFGIDSRPALIAEKYAEAQGKGDVFHKAVMHAYWQEARSIDDPAVLEEIAEEVGLRSEAAKFLVGSGSVLEEIAEEVGLRSEDAINRVPTSVLTDPVFDAAVSADVELAHEYGLSGVPALVFADRYLVMGAQPYEVLRRVVEKILEEE